MNPKEVFGILYKDAEGCTELHGDTMYVGKGVALREAAKIAGLLCIPKTDHGRWSNGTETINVTKYKLK